MHLLIKKYPRLTCSKALSSGGEVWEGFGISRNRYCDRWRAMNKQ